MIYLIADRANTVKVEINSGMRLEGFSAVLTACGVTKTISDLTKTRLEVEYSAEESNHGGNGVFGELLIKDIDGKVCLKLFPQFKTVPSQESYKAVGTQVIPVTIPPMFNENGGGGDFSNLSHADNSIKSNTAVINQMVDLLKGVSASA